MDFQRGLKDKLQQRVSNKVKPDRKLHSRCRYVVGKHSYQNNSNNRDVVEPSEDANDLPEPFGRIL